MGVIVTDMGWETISWTESEAIASPERLGNWWKEYIDENYDLLFGTSEEGEDIEAQPETLSWMVAKAVYGEERWILWLWPLEMGGPSHPTWAEAQAIWLGVAMANVLGVVDATIINDNKDAVKACGGRTSWKEGRSGIVWRKRGHVGAAHRFSRAKATRELCSPDIPLNPDGGYNNSVMARPSQLQRLVLNDSL